MDGASHETIAFELPQLLGEHLLRHAGDLTFELERLPSAEPIEHGTSVQSRRLDIRWLSRVP